MKTPLVTLLLLLAATAAGAAETQPPDAPQSLQVCVFTGTDVPYNDAHLNHLHGPHDIPASMFRAYIKHSQPGATSPANQTHMHLTRFSSASLF